MCMKTKAIYEKGTLKLLEKIDLKEGEEVEIEVRSSMTRRLRGIVKYWDGLEEAHEEYKFDIHRR